MRNFVGSRAFDSDLTFPVRHNRNLVELEMVVQNNHPMAGFVVGHRAAFVEGMISAHKNAFTATPAMHLTESCL